MEWVKVKVDGELPGLAIGQICDVWIETNEDDAHRRTDYVFVDHVGVNKRYAFQGYAAHLHGLYEDAFFLDENIITNYMIVHPPKQ